MVPSTYPDKASRPTRRGSSRRGSWRKGIDDGVLVLVAKDDRRMRIEVGYGLEGTITDIDAGRIIREYMTPAFRQARLRRRPGSGGAARLVRLIDGEALPPPPRDPLEPGAVRQTLAIAFLLGALGGVALLVRPRAWYWTLGAVVALAAALALGRQPAAGAMVALAEMVAVLGVGFGALLAIRAVPAGSSPFLCSMRWAVLGLPPLWPAGAPLRIGRAAFAGADPADAGRCLAGGCAEDGAGPTCRACSACC
ncbi:TPM domain-containing protein [Pseudomonas aeruginosa]|nr:TPM domain-containing protein [Pseudomonas aeruginosa]